MNQVQCAYCLSTNVTVVSSEENKEAVTIKCLACGRESQIDVENFNVDLNDLPRE